MADGTSGTKPTPAELVGLEHAFAVDSQSDAYRPLTEAYLALGRYMEAMVVGKAGMKAHPDSPEPRILLARIYGQQGRKKKALEELDAALERGAGEVDTLLTIARLRLENEEREGAELLVKQAAVLAPGNPEVEALAATMGVVLETPRPETPEPPQQAPEPPASGLEAGGGDPGQGQGQGQRHAMGEGAAAAAAVPPAAIPPDQIPPGFGAAMQGASASAQGARAGGAESRARAEGRAASPTAPSAAVSAAGQVQARVATRPAFDPESWDFEDDDRPASAGSRRQLYALLGAVVLVIVGLGGWHFYTDWQKNREHQIGRLINQTNDQLRKDTYASYKAAAGHAREILDLDGGNLEGHAYLAFINVLRWGEQGEGEDFREAARMNLEQAKKAGQPHGRIIAAEAYLKFFEGDPKAAEATIREVLDAGQRSWLGLLYGTLGTIQMWAGELDEASLSLKQAQSLEPNSVRILAALGQLHRRRGMDTQAWTFYDTALRVDGDHAESLLGKALLILDANDADRPLADKEKLLAEAEVQIEKVLKLPDGAISARQLAVGKFASAQLHYAREQRREGERLEQEAFTLDPRNADLRLLRGRRLLRENDVDGAVTEIREAIRIDGNRAAFYVDLSHALLAKKGGATEAVEALETALKTYPKSGRLYVLLGDAHRAVPAVEEARKAYERALEVENLRFPEASARLGTIWREKKEFAKASEEVEKALKDLGLTTSGPTLALALTERGRIFEEQPRPDVNQAFERYEKAIAASGRYAPPHYFAGRILAAQRERERQQLAIESLETYLRLAPRGEFAEDARAILARIR